MLGGIFGKKKEKPKTTSSVQLSPAISETILNVVGSRAIPPMPAAAQKAFKLSTDPNAEARDFIEVIESDEALSARVIKIANSVYFDRGHPSKTIEQSVVVIGMEELRSLLSATALSEMFASRHSARAQLWSNDIATALISRSLAQRFNPQKADVAFLGGLMHDIGKLLLLQRVQGDYEKVLRAVEAQGLDFCKAEESLFPFNHCEAGQLIAERWNFSPELIEIIRFHHTAPENPHDLPALVQAADLVAHALGLGHPRTFTRVRSTAEERLPETFERLGLASGEQKDFLQNCKREYDLEHDLYAGKSI
jgi:HD-like signal output (HDOD) protein